MENKKPKVAIYTRVSTSEQSCENQIPELLAYCQREGLEVFKIYKDEGISGAKASRPGLDAMLQDMRARKFSRIVVWKLDRLGRSLVNAVQVMRECDNLGVKVISTTQGINTDTPTGKFICNVLFSFAEMELEMIRERSKLGQERARKLGKPIGKRGRDKRQRRKSGYLLRWARQREAVTV